MAGEAIFGLQFDGQGIRDFEAAITRIERGEHRLQALGDQAVNIEFDVEALRLFERHVQRAIGEAERLREAFKAGQIPNPLGDSPERLRAGAAQMAKDLSRLEAMFTNATGRAKAMGPALNEAYRQAFLAAENALRADAGGYARGQRAAILGQMLPTNLYTPGVSAGANLVQQARPPAPGIILPPGAARQQQAAAQLLGTLQQQAQAHHQIFTTQQQQTAQMRQQIAAARAGGGGWWGAGGGGAGGGSMFGGAFGGWSDFRRGFKGRSDHPFAEQIGSAAKYSLLYGGAYMALNAVTDTLGRAFEQAVEFQRGLADLALATDRPTAELRGLGERIAQIAASTGAEPFGALQAAKLALGQYGLTQAPAQQQDLVALSAARTASQMALLSGQTAMDIQQQLGAATNNLQLGPTGQQFIADLDTYFTQRFGTERGSTLETVARTGALGRTAGFSPAELSGLAADVQARTGQSPAAVAGYLDTIISRGGVRAFEERVAKFGVDTAASFRDQLLQISELFTSGTLSGRQQEELLALFGRGPTKEAAGVVVSSFGGVVQEAKAAEAGAAAGKTAEAVAAQMGNLGAQLRVFREHVDLLARHLGESGLLDGLGAVIKAVDFVVQSVDPLVSLFASLPGPIQATAGALVLLATAANAGRIGGLVSGAAGAVLPGLAVKQALAGAGVGGAAAATQAAAAGGAFAGLSRMMALAVSPAVLWTAAIGGSVVALGAGVRAVQNYHQALDDGAKLAAVSLDSLTTPEQKRAHATALTDAAIEIQRQGGGVGGGVARVADFYRALPGAGFNIFKARDQVNEQFAVSGQYRDRAAEVQAAADEQAETLRNAALAGTPDILEVARHKMGDTADEASVIAAAFDELIDKGHSGSESMRILSRAILNLGESGLLATTDLRDKVNEERARHKLALTNLPGGDFGDAEQAENKLNLSNLMQLRQAAGDHPTPELLHDIAEAEQAIVQHEMDRLERARKAAQQGHKSISAIVATDRAFMEKEVAAAVEGNASPEQYNELIERFGSGAITVLKRYMTGQLKLVQSLTAKIAQQEALVASLAAATGPMAVDQLTGKQVAPFDIGVGPTFPGLGGIAGPGGQPGIGVFKTPPKPGVDYLPGLDAPGATPKRKLTPEDQKRLADLKAQRRAAEEEAKRIGRALKAAHNFTGETSLSARDANRDTAEEIAAARRAALVDPGDQLAQDQVAISNARDVLQAQIAKDGGRGKTVAYWNAVRALHEAEYKYSQDKAAQALAVANATDQLRGDITDPVENARDALRAAQRKLDQDRKLHPSDKGLIAQDEVAVRQQRAALARTAFNQDMEEQRTKYELGHLSFGAYQRYLTAQRDRLQKIKHRSYDEQQELYEVERQLKGLADQLQGQFNLGSIRLPTVYQARRIAGGDGASLPRVQTVRTEQKVTVGLTPQAAALFQQVTAPPAITNTTKFRK